MLFKRLRSLREDADITQKQIAYYLNIDQSTYSDYETGNLNISVETLIQLSNFYKTSIDYLVGKTNVKKPYKNSTTK